MGNPRRGLRPTLRRPASHRSLLPIDASVQCAAQRSCFGVIRSRQLERREPTLGLVEKTATQGRVGEQEIAYGVLLVGLEIAHDRFPPTSMGDGEHVELTAPRCVSPALRRNLENVVSADVERFGMSRERQVRTRRRLVDDCSCAGPGVDRHEANVVAIDARNRAPAEHRPVRHARADRTLDR